MTGRQRFLVGACVLGPLVLWMGLFALAPQFVGLVFVRPLGWFIVTAVVLFLGLSYFLQRWVLLRPVVAESSRLLMDELTLRVLVLMGTIVFLVLPAVALIFFGPAIVTVTTMMGQ
jgi:hypothetical protein